jgi:hypothetical protein
MHPFIRLTLGTLSLALGAASFALAQIPGLPVWVALLNLACLMLAIAGLLVAVGASR